jgi:hypothetical protein
MLVVVVKFLPKFSSTYFYKIDDITLRIQNPNSQEETNENIELTTVHQDNSPLETTDLEQGDVIETNSEQNVSQRSRTICGESSSEFGMAMMGIVYVSLAIFTLVYNIHGAIKTNNDPNASAKDKGLE